MTATTPDGQWPRTLALNAGPGDLLVDGVLAVRNHVRLLPESTESALVGAELYRDGRLELVGARDAADSGRRKVSIVGDLEHGLGRSVTMSWPTEAGYRPFVGRTARGSGVEAVNVLQPVLDVAFDGADGCGVLFDVSAFVHGRDVSCALAWSFALAAGPAGAYRSVAPLRRARMFAEDDWELLVRNTSWTSARVALRWRAAALWSNRQPSVTLVARAVMPLGDDARCAVVGLDAQLAAQDATAYAVVPSVQ